MKKITEGYEQLAEMHSMLAEYHRKLAKEARLDIVRDYHVDLAQRLADEATQIPRRAATLARFHKREQQVTRELGMADLEMRQRALQTTKTNQDQHPEVGKATSG